MSTSRYQPALLGGLFVGTLSSLPLISALNACCCLWVVAGGVLTAYLRQQQLPEAIEAGEAALGGLLAGVIGALLTIVATMALLNVTGPVWQEQLRRELESNPDIPLQVRDMVLRMMSGSGLALLQIGITLPVYAVFGTLGGLLGMALFKKKPEVRS
jgi:hypothetical protein